MNDLGTKIGGFLNGVLMPVNNLIGTGTTTTTTGADPAQQSNTKTAFLVISVLGIVVLITIGVIIYKNNKS